MYYGSPRITAEKGAENLCEEITAGNFPNLGKETDTSIRKQRKFHQNQQKQANTKAYRKTCKI